MAIGILKILDLGPPLEIWTRAFAIFYIEAERLITSAQNRGPEILNLYDVIIATIDTSLLSNSKGLKTWLTEAYQVGKSQSELDILNYNDKAILFVDKLQLLVLDRYDSIDDFYEDEGIIVSQIFADLSEAAGYPISPQYIEDIS